ncbi:serine/threonine-protein kinase [Streptomyces phaeoluteigriseus]|uniref:serine/threonine-protein kinase n=1 Tax=Streptomyces phaeoluteigriseus TaxID=114686 RepID=UPI0036B11578
MGFRESRFTLAARPSARILAGRYRLDARIGSGGAADVHRGFDLRLRRPVALKLFRPDTGFDTEEAFLSEAMILARLQHPGLVTAYDAGRHGGDAYLVMQLIEGQTLKERIAEDPLPPEATAALGAGLAEALAHAHDAGIVHRDVKPSNVILDRSGQPHLTDFGISRLLGATTCTATGTLIGTAAYLSPEQVLGRPVGRPADVYALGLVLLECLTGRLEYDGGPLEAAIARLHRQPRLPDHLPDELAALLRDMTALDEQTRPTARDCARTLAALSADTDLTAHQPAARATSVAASRRPTSGSIRTHRNPLPGLVPGPERSTTEASHRAAPAPPRTRSRALMAGATAALAAAMAATLAVTDGSSHQGAGSKADRPAGSPVVTSPGPDASQDGKETPATPVPQPAVSHSIPAQPPGSSAPAPSDSATSEILSRQAATDAGPTSRSATPQQKTTDATARSGAKNANEPPGRAHKKASKGKGNAKSGNSGKGNEG